MNIRENESARCKIISYHDNRHFQMKEVDIEGFKITVKNMTMLINMVNHSQKSITNVLE